MKSPWFPVLVGFLAGILFVFCTTDDRESARDAGAVGDAFAGEDAAAGAGCCEPGPYSFTVLAEGGLSSVSNLSDPIAVGDYREVVVSITGGCDSAQSVLPEFRTGAEGTFREVGQFVPGRIRVDGTELRLRYTCGFNGASYTVVGVR